MSGGKTIISFAAGIVSGLAVAYFLDPKGSKKRLKVIEKDLKKNKKVLDKKIDAKFGEVKTAYNDAVDKYSATSKSLLDKAKGIIENSKETAKAD